MKLKNFLAALFIVLAFSACSKSDDGEGGGGGTSGTKNYIVTEETPYRYPKGHPKAGAFIRSALTNDDVVKYSFDFIYKPLEKRPVRVHFYLPNEADLATCPVLIAITGVDRNATNMTIQH